MLKQFQEFLKDELVKPAAFRRLRVETFSCSYLYGVFFQPPLGGCVLKRGVSAPLQSYPFQPPLGGCVLKQGLGLFRAVAWFSRL